jgi:endonuclease YncB( thermonuclease family)
MAAAMGPALLAAALMAALWAAAPAAAQDRYAGRVDRVIDGDTISVLTTDYERIRVRLYGIDAPERGQEGGPASTAALSSMLAGRQVEVEVHDIDRYSRQVAVVFLGGRNVNLEMVRQGHAWVYDRYCKLPGVCREMARAQGLAKSEGKGLWGRPGAVPPWDHRRRRN